MAYRTAVQDATKFTPVYLMFGHELCTPVDLIFGIRPLAPGDGTIRLLDYLNQLKQWLDVAHYFAQNNIQGKGKSWSAGMMHEPRRLVSNSASLCGWRTPPAEKDDHGSSGTGTWVCTPSFVRSTTSTTSSSWHYVPRKDWCMLTECESTQVQATAQYRFTSVIHRPSHQPEVARSEQCL